MYCKAWWERQLLSKNEKFRIFQYQLHRKQDVILISQKEKDLGENTDFGSIFSLDGIGLSDIRVWMYQRKAQAASCGCGVGNESVLLCIQRHCGLTHSLAFYVCQHGRAPEGLKPWLYRPGRWVGITQAAEAAGRECLRHLWTWITGPHPKPYPLRHY